MDNGQPILVGEDEAIRLHAIAHTAAIQTGLQDYALDVLTAEIFSALVKHSNVAAMQLHRRSSLRVVE